MGSKVRLWRWRRNPLRRRSDLAEAWIGLATVILLLCAVAAAGWLTGQATNRGLQRTVRHQLAERGLVPAAVLGTAPRSAAGADADSGRGRDRRHGAVLSWTAPDGSARSGTVRVEAQQRVGGRLHIWTDRSGQPVDPPLDHATAAAHAALAGFGSAAVAGVGVVAARQLLLRRLMRRRLLEWEREWARVGQDWGRAGAGG
ncbi:hypothetical protein QMK19_24030 [Streptomyces sp. H10-C2]|uniref:Rv1733c family protein n=1 Tax=unclassified Streptomyces TaxID=2593676 RepID=UPI0024BAF6F5|nr:MULTISPECIES: hypothetical protein [unclassified Streptomyces]MDJ0342875.1 hypothetical protein [Streptomyces sp. PH10-H1]MDJ0372648.1 hypothetical protein [Streptomyces sp. H10-C2]